MNRLYKGYERAVDKIWGIRAKNGFLVVTEVCVPIFTFIVNLFDAQQPWTQPSWVATQI